MPHIGRGLAVLLLWIAWLTTAATAAGTSLSFVTVPGNTTVLEDGRVVANGAAGDEAAFDLHPSVQSHTFVVRRPHFDDMTLHLTWTGQGWILDGRSFPTGSRVHLSKSVRLNVPAGVSAFVEAKGNEPSIQSISVGGVPHSVVPLEPHDGLVTIPDAWLPRPVFLVKTGFESSVLVLPSRSLDSESNVVPQTPVALSVRWYLRWPALLSWAALMAISYGAGRKIRTTIPAVADPPEISPFMQGVNLVTRDGRRYQVLERIGSGTSGEVFQVLDESSGALRAAKVWFSAPFCSDRLARFEREVTICSRLQHPGLVAVHGYGVYEESVGASRPFMIEDLLAGQTLKEMLKSHQAMPWILALERMSALLQALAAAHAQGVVHRDISPANIMVEHDGTVRLMDFGLARSTHEASLTASGAALGTPFYMSPEQYENSHAATAASDIYSAGVIFYQMLTGRVPFRQTELWSLLHEKLTSAPPTVLNLAPDVPPFLDRLVARMMHPDPQARWACVEDILAQFDTLSPDDTLECTLVGTRVNPADTDSTLVD